MSIYKKLHEAKKEIGVIAKDSQNPFFKSDYLSLNGLLNAVDSVFDKHGLLILQPIEAGWLKTKIFDIESGEDVSSEMHLPDLKDPQKLGSAITYYRRYTLQSLLGLQADDDDGNMSSSKESTKTKVIDKKQNLSNEEYLNLQKKANYKHIDTYLSIREVTAEQRKALLKLKELL